ncbi:MAG TPA: hypothetical protein PLP83_06710 [Candidatus Aminicenantes bacterium]|nr:hypothetical protein [Candidatus Aminicenantes bacterium]
MRKTRALAIGLLAAALAAPAASGQAPEAQARRGSPGVTGLVPKLDGWALTEAVRSFFPDDLFEYIDGAAESYLGYDFRELAVADFERAGSDAALTVEIYDMGTALNAFGIFGSERYPGNEAVGVGELGYLEGEALNFLAGRFYVKMLAFGLGEGTGPFLLGAGKRIASGIEPAGGAPALVRAFPKEGLVARSEKYISRNFMGYGFLRDGYVASYRAGEREIEGFFIDGGSEREAEAMRARLVEALAADGQAPEALPAGTRVRNRSGQTFFVGRVGAVVCGAMRVPAGLEAAGQALLDSLAAALAGTKLTM